jgi:hypothetical protein
LLELPPLRDYQARGVAATRDAVLELRRERAGCGVLIVAPTGAGKTRMGLEVTTGAMRKHRRALWIAPRNELVEQPVRRMRDLGFHDIRTIYAGRDEGDPGASMIVASVQTLLARDLRPPADVVVLDEARHMVAPDWGRVADPYRGVVRIGLDATPARGDGAPLGDLFDRIVPVSSIDELTRLGWLVPARIIGPDSYAKTLACTPLQAYLEDAPGKRCLLFAASKAQAKREALAFRVAGIPAEAVDADSTLEQRRGALERLRRGDILVLVNVMLFTEGLDLVELESIIIARGISTPGMWLQIGGRGIRPSAHTGKTMCTISDLRGHFHRQNFGPLSDPRVWSLEGKPIQTTEQLTAVVQCRDCHGWHRSGGACPTCGARLPDPPAPRVTKRERRELLRKARRAAALEQRTGAAWDYFRELVLEQRSRGFKPRWVMMRFRARFGRFPKWGHDAVEGDAKALRRDHPASSAGDHQARPGGTGAPGHGVRVAQQSPTFQLDLEGVE